jgi:ketosteroid isomerase-like protein
VSEENVERIRAGFAAHSRGDIDAMVELYDQDAVFETLLLGTHHGKEAIRRLYEENQTNQSGYTIEPVEMIDAGDKVVTVVQTRGTGPASQIALEDRFAFVHTMRNGLIVREQAFRNREEAVEAAGLTDH